MNHENAWRTARLFMGLSLEEASLGICSPSLLSLIERGKRTPSRKIGSLLETRLRQGLENTTKPGFSDSFLLFRQFLRLGDEAQSLEAAANIEDSAETVLALALVSESQGKLQEAEDALVKLLQTEALDPSLYVAACQVLVRLNRDKADFYTAIYWGERGLSSAKLDAWRTEGYYELQATLSSIYVEVGDYSRAISLVQGSDARTEKSWDYIVRLWAEGMAHHAHGNAVSAASLLRKASTLADEYDRETSKARISQTALWLECQCDQLDYNRAEEEIKGLIEFFERRNLNTDLAHGLNTYALVLIRKGKSMEAQEMANLSDRLVGGLPLLVAANILTSNATIYSQIGDVEQARANLRNAFDKLEGLKANRASASTWAAMGKLFEDIGDQTFAATCFKASVEYAGLMPSHNQRVASQK